MIVIVDYEMGNLGSVAKALSFLGHSATISSDPAVVRKAERLILPGVGALSYAMLQLKSKGLNEAIAAFCQTERPFLGICLGMQLMFEQSEEGEAFGLGIIPGSVRKLKTAAGCKIPHIGWNQIAKSRTGLIKKDEFFYFVHSYQVLPADGTQVVATAWHGHEITAAVQYDNVLLTQFHPEKSGEAGLGLLDRWIQA